HDALPSFPIRRQGADSGKRPLLITRRANPPNPSLESDIFLPVRLASAHTQPVRLGCPGVDAGAYHFINENYYQYRKLKKAASPQARQLGQNRQHLIAGASKQSVWLLAGGKAQRVMASRQ